MCNVRRKEDSCDRVRRVQCTYSRLLSNNHYSLLICRYNYVMISQGTVTIMANFDVITFVYIDARSQGLSWHAIYCRKF